MSVLLVQDYLQTQGLRLPQEAVRIAYLAAQSVMNMGKASIERNVLWYENDEVVLAEHFEKNDENENLLKQIFMALDSTVGRQKDLRSASVYVLMPSEKTPYLLRLAQQGQVVEQKIMVNEESGWQHLPSRAAQTGWLNLANNVEQWLEWGDLQGEHNQRSQSQISLPICTAGGKVLGVLHAEHSSKNAFDENAQADWAGLAIALTEPLKMLLNDESEEEEADD